LNDNTSAAFEVNGAIARLFVYPVKSCAGVELQDSVLTETGLDLDRAWMVVDANGVFVSQRALPRMALIRPQLKLYEVVLRAPGMLALHLQIDRVEKATQVKVWDDVVNAFDMGDLAAQWFSDFLNDSPGPTPDTGRQEYRLVRFDPDHKRLSKMNWTQGVEAPNQFADGFPALVISTASLDGLNRRLIAQGHAAVTMERFRPNIVLSGLDEHDEDRMDGMTVTTEAGDAVLRPVKPCPRCPIPNIDPLTASVSPEVGDTLQTYRQDARVGGAITFGMNVIVIDGVDLQLKVGQKVGGNHQF
jgi:uncharacterized protein YcbX